MDTTQPSPVDDKSPASTSSSMSIRRATGRLHSLLSIIGRLILVYLYLCDAWILASQWDDQLWYLRSHRHHSPNFLQAFLKFNIIGTLVGATALLTYRFRKHGAAGYLCILGANGLVYRGNGEGSIFHRNAATIGLLLTILSEPTESAQIDPKPKVEGPEDERVAEKTPEAGV